MRVLQFHIHFNVNSFFACSLLWFLFNLYIEVRSYVDDFCISFDELLNLVGVTRSTLYRWMDAGTFPKQISVGGNTVVWVESVVTAWMEDQMASR